MKCPSSKTVYYNVKVGWKDVQSEKIVNESWDEHQTVFMIIAAVLSSSVLSTEARMTAKSGISGVQDKPQQMHSQICSHPTVV